jgi:DNA-binding transcriptional regulator YiaG
MKKKYYSEALMVIHQDAAGSHQLGIIDDARMREYDEGCLVPEPKVPKVIIKHQKAAAYTSPRRS